MSNSIRRVLATGAVAAISLAGAVAPAAAEDTAPACDPVALNAAVKTASDEVRAAKKAYVVHTSTSMQALLKKFKQREAHQARAAAALADKLAKKAAKHTSSKPNAAARAAARVARIVARTEAKEAARIRQSSVQTLIAAVKAERKELKKAWESASEKLRDLRRQAEDCADSAPEGGTA